MLRTLEELSGKAPDEAIRIIENHLRALGEELEFILSHLDSSNITEIDLNITRVYEGENEN